MTSQTRTSPVERLARACMVLATGFVVSSCVLVPGLRVGVDGAGAVDSAVPYTVVQLTAATIAAERSQQAAKTIPIEMVDYSAPPSNYLIGPGDILQVVVWDHPELNNPFGATTRDTLSSGQLVGADGYLRFPYVGDFLAGGKTVAEVRSYIQTRIASSIAKPQVDVRVVGYRSQRVQVTGEVKNPGTVYLDDTVKGLLEAVGERGGLTAEASRRTVILNRGGNRYNLDLAALLSGSQPAGNPLLRGGDVIQVPDAGDDQVFVLGEVAKQGAVVLAQRELTVTEALTKTGGLDKVTANDAGLLVFRRSDQQQGQAARVYALDLGRPEGLLLAGEFTLKPRDVVYVKATAFAQYNLIINQLLPTISSIYQLDRLVSNN